MKKGFNIALGVLFVFFVLATLVGFLAGGRFVDGSSSISTATPTHLTLSTTRFSLKNGEFHNVVADGIVLFKITEKFMLDGTHHQPVFSDLADGVRPSKATPVGIDDTYSVSTPWGGLIVYMKYMGRDGDQYTINWT